VNIEKDVNEMAIQYPNYFQVIDQEVLKLSINDTVFVNSAGYFENVLRVELSFATGQQAHLIDATIKEYYQIIGICQRLGYTVLCGSHPVLYLYYGGLGITAEAVKQELGYRVPYPLKFIELKYFVVMSAKQWIQIDERDVIQFKGFMLESMYEQLQDASEDEEEDEVEEEKDESG
jgi:hypothetical protein